MFESLLNSIQNLSLLAADLGIIGAPATSPAGDTPAQPVQIAGEVAAGAQAAAPAGEPMSMIWWIVIYGAMFAALYFFLFRPQRKREKKMREVQAGIKAGDNIVTNSGLFGRVSDVGTDCFIVEFGISGKTVRIPVLKADVAGVREPVMTPPPKE